MSTFATVVKDFVKLMRSALSGDLDEFAFVEPEQPPAVGTTAIVFSSGEYKIPKDRWCCALGGSTSQARSLEDIRGVRHEYGAGALSISGTDTGEALGYVYTVRGGFIDLGHVRDLADYTRWFANKFYSAGNKNENEVKEYELFENFGELIMEIAPRQSRPNTTIAALVGAKLAYEHAVWYEIATYSGGAAIHQYSSFAPEDNFSNAFGVLVGYLSLIVPGVLYDDLVHMILLDGLTALGAVEKETTSDAIDYVEDYWWKEAWGNPLDNVKPRTIRKHMDALSPISPWLITDISIPGKVNEGVALQNKLGNRPKAARITIPSRSSDGTVLSSLAKIKIKNVDASVASILPPLLPAEITADLFPTFINHLRTKVRSDFADEIQPSSIPADQPGQKR